MIGLGKYSSVICAFIANIILARILTPEEYGVVAVVTVFTSFFMLFTDMGFGAGIIQNKELTEDDINSVFSFTIYIGLICMAVFCLFVPAIAFIYSNRVYLPIGYVLSISLFFHSINMVPNGLLMRSKRFAVVGFRTFAVSLVTYAITILLAVRGASYYALVFQSVVYAFLTFLWNYMGTRPKFVLKPRYASLKKILSFSANSFLYDIINYATRNIDSLLTGSMIGEAALGYYNKAYTLMLYPTHYLTNIITPVMHPILSDYRDKKVIYIKYSKVNHFLTLVGVFISAYCFYAAEELICILYGTDWAAAVPCMKVLSLSIFIQMSVSSCTSIFRSLNRTDLRLKSCLVYAPVQIVMIILGVRTGSIEQLAVYVTISYVARYCIEYYYLIHKAFEMSLKEYVKENIGSLAIFAVLMIVMYFTKWISTDNMLQSAVMKLVICILAYIIALIVFRQIKFFISILPDRFQKKIKYNK